MPLMHCLTSDNQCVGIKVASKSGYLPISAFTYLSKKPKESSNAININDDFYKDLKNNRDNPTLEEYEYIKNVISFLHAKFDSSKSFYVLRAVSIFYAYHGVNVELEDGIVMDTSGDYINFHDHSGRSICFRREIIK